MNRFKLTPLKLFVPFLFCGFVAQAQKLPAIQQASVPAPGNIKIDGKATEWNNQYQAYNKATEVYYTLSNNADNLYLTIEATDKDIINKIMHGGITFNASAEKKKLNSGLSVTFPAYQKGMRYEGLPLNSEYASADAKKRALNDLLGVQAKFISITGGETTLNDTLLSVYNTGGIKARAAFDNKTVFTYELAIPLKYLNLNADNAKLNYSITLNGPAAGSIKTVETARGQLVLYTGIDGRDHTVGTSSAQNMAYAFPTDLKGEYVLAK